jgi:hypothetical protein
MEGLVGTLPGGYWDQAGRLQRDFELAMLTGREEELLVQARSRPPASLVSAVLSRCVRRLGDICPVSEDVARSLLVADRQYLLLQMRQATFGGLVRAHVFCPWPDCGKRVSLEFSIADVPVTEAAEPGPFYSLWLSPEAAGDDGAAQREVIFRLPNGGDQEAAAPLLADNDAQALTRLLARCVQRIGPLTPPGEERIAALSALARCEIEAEMERLAPRVDLDMEASCAECGRSFAAPFDIQRFFFGELRTDSDLLYREVHYLAYHYHWAEREIMDMTRDRRRKYIQVLAEEIERLNNAS